MNGKISEVEKSWAAGFFDGEGSITPTTRNRLHLQIRITNTDVDVINFFQQRWGGEIITSRPPLSRRMAYQLHFYPPEKARKLLEDLLPYLQLKKAQAELALNWIDTLRRFSWYESRGRGRGLPASERKWLEEASRRLDKLNKGGEVNILPPAAKVNQGELWN